MALDIGDVRIGIAVSDPQGKVASPICVLPSSEVQAHGASFRRVLDDWEPEYLLFGLPYTMDGHVGPQGAHVKEIAAIIAKQCNLPYGFTDERLSSGQAKRSMHDAGMKEKDMRGKVDMVAASLFLQAWLDSKVEG